MARVICSTVLYGIALSLLCSRTALPKKNFVRLCVGLPMLWLPSLKACSLAQVLDVRGSEGTPQGIAGVE
jgi:ABC-type Fe3+ transport system permease subunit